MHLFLRETFCIHEKEILVLKGSNAFITFLHRPSNHIPTAEFLPNTSIYLVQQCLLLQNRQFANTGGTHCKYTFAKKGSDPQWVRGMREEGEEDAFPSTALFTDAIHLVNAIVTPPLQKKSFGTSTFLFHPSLFLPPSSSCKKNINVYIYIWRES